MDEWMNGVSGDKKTKTSSRLGVRPSMLHGIENGVTTRARENKINEAAMQMLSRVM